MSPAERQREEAAHKGYSALLALSQEMPFGIAHVVADRKRKNTLGVFASYSLAAETIARARNRRHDRLRWIGNAIVSLSGTGRPVDLYFNGEWWEPKRDNLRHTYHETSVQLALRAAFPFCAFLRGPRTGERRADLVQLWPEGDEIFHEVDCNTAGETRVKDRWTRLLGSGRPVCVEVALRNGKALSRIKKLIAWGAEVGDFLDWAYFAPLESVMADPAGRIWIDCETTLTNNGFTLEEVREKHRVSPEIPAGTPA